MSAKIPESQSKNITQLFAYIYDDLVSILKEDHDLLIRLTDSLTYNLLRHLVDKEKILRSSNSMGCKMLTNAVLTYLNRARHPDHSISNLLHIFESYKELEPLVHKIRERAEMKLNTKICSAQPLLEVQDNEARIHIESQPLPPVTKDQTNVKLKSCFELPPDPKRFLAVASDFIPLDKFSLKGESSIGQKSQLSIDELCNMPPSSWILIEGISGIGKSTLAYEMLKQWKDGTALCKYSYVLLLRLRNENVHQYWSPLPNVTKLIKECLNEQYSKPPEIKSILDDKGHNLLLILEGYDELPKGKIEFQMKVFQELKSCFDNAVVIITTQPSLSYQLTGNILFTKTIELLGFSKSNQDRFIKMALKSNSDKIKEFKEGIKRCPITAQYLSVPLHLAIMIKVFSSGTQKPLPQTITELYESFVMILICRSLNDQTLYHNFKCLPWEMKGTLRNHCKSAYDNVFENKKHEIFFDCRDSSIIGLTQKKSRSAAETLSLHFTIQEFLATYHVHMPQNKPIEEKMKFLEKINHELPTTMCFMTGLISSHENMQSDENNYFQLNFLHQLMEINDEALVSEVLKNRTIEVSRLSRTLTLQDFYVLGRCFALSSCSWKLGFTLRGLSSEHIKMFVSGFNDVKPQSQQQPILERIVLSLNPIGNEGLATFLSLPPSVLCTITEFFLRAASLKNNDRFKNCVTKFKHFDALKIFLFHDNNFKEGEQQQLIDVLCTLKNLEKVSLSSLSPQECFTLLSQSHLTQLELYELSLKSAEKLLASLSQCMTLKCIELYQSPITKEIVERSLQHSLPPCTLMKLTELKLINCKIYSETAILIINAAMHSPTLQVIDLSDNVIDDKGGCYIASKLCALYQKLLPNPAENIMQLFLQHNCFTEESITRFTEELAQLPHNFAIHLSLQWKEFIEKECSSSHATNDEESLSADNENDNLILRGNTQYKVAPVNQ